MSRWILRLNTLGLVLYGALAVVLFIMLPSTVPEGLVDGIPTRVTEDVAPWWVMRVVVPLILLAPPFTFFWWLVEIRPKMPMVEARLAGRTTPSAMDLPETRELYCRVVGLACLALVVLATLRLVHEFRIALAVSEGEVDFFRPGLGVIAIPLALWLLVAGIWVEYRRREVLRRLRSVSSSPGRAQ